MDPLSIIVDEVALEGLDGITIPTLWIRLENRQPKFPLKLDDCTKGFVWRSLVSVTDLRFYELPQEREDVELFDRFRNIDPETGVETREDFSPECRDVYPVHVIPENKAGIQGSCVFFKERKDVTKQIRSKSLTPLFSLEEVLNKYGRKLVVVASQALRFRTLIGTEGDPDIKLSSDSYCVLERVGRARWQGELQTNLHGGLFKVDARKFHYLRKSLVKHDLVTNQSHVRRLKLGYQQQHSVLLLLKRFHVNRRSKYDILMECTSNYLQQLPGQFSTVDLLKEHLDVTDGNFKRLFKHVRSGKYVRFYHCPLEDLNPSAGPLTNKNGSKVLVRCVKLLKPYTKKGVPDDDDDEDEEDYTGARREGAVPSEGRIMERDFMSQAYNFILSCGTKGVAQKDISFQMNIGFLESRMTWRKLERDGIIKGFMEDVGRQRMTKYISHKCVDDSDKLQLFAKEKERTKLLCSSAPQLLETEPTSPETLTNTSNKTASAKRKRKAGGGRKKDAEKEQQVCDDNREDVGDTRSGGKRGRLIKKTSVEDDGVTTEKTQPDVPIIQSAQAECETSACTESTTSMNPNSGSIPASVEEEQPCNHIESVPQSEAVNPSDNPENKIIVVDNIPPPQRSHETYRLLKRKNLIVEAVRNLKIIDGFFPLLKMIIDEETQDGVSTKCCKKTILRLVQSLSRENLLKLYTTTVIQDGITKKVDIIVHPSIQPNDERVSQLLDQIRFKISSSAAAVSVQHAVAKANEQQKPSGSQSNSKNLKGKAGKKSADKEKETSFKPTPVPGLGRRLGFQPKMPRLHIIHNFLWYVIYGHPLKNSSTESSSANQTSEDPNASSSDAKLPECQTQQDGNESKSSVSKPDEASGDEEELLNDKSILDHSESNKKVYVDEDSWRRFVPPVRLRKDFTSGWVMVGDLLLCLPLSIFLQFTQIKYKVDGLEEYVNDPVKQHYLVSALPQTMRRQLLFKRKYIFAFHENLQKLVCMGLLQFAPVEKFKDRDQVFLYLKHNATIVDTTSTEPHYWLVSEPPDKPFERRHYTFNTAEDVESYWFDMMCVCLNTPLGVVRTKRNVPEDESAPSFVNDDCVLAGQSSLLKGSDEVCDDGSIPGDGKGAAGLDSEFFAHLKRNWFWISQLLVKKTIPNVLGAPSTKSRLKSLLNRDTLRIAVEAGLNTVQSFLTIKQPPMREQVKVGIEPASRNRLGIGGRGRKRRKNRKEAVKVTRKKRKEPKKRDSPHDETDHMAIRRMTKRRVYWAVQEDSFIMLCSMASHLLNSKLKKPFFSYVIVRDLLHAEFRISLDKTSIAVGRRTRYILKNPQTFLNFRICLAEVFQDKILMKQLEENKPANPNEPEDCTKSFLEYFRLLRQKFSSVISAHDVILPDSKQELFSQFKVSVIDDGKQHQDKDTLNSLQDIHAIVLHNLIQSTLVMTNGQMKSSRSFLTFHTYSKYDQDLLCQVFLQSRKKRQYNRRRNSNLTEPKKNRGLPILPMSFQMSQTYYRRFLWRFPQSLLTDSFCFLRNLFAKGSDDKRPVTTFYHETEIRSQNGEEMLERKTESTKAKPTGAQEAGETVTESQKQAAAADMESTKEGEDEENKTQETEKSTESDVIENTGERSSQDEQKHPESGSDGALLSSEQTDDPADSLVSTVRAAGAPDDSPDVSDMLRLSLSSPGAVCVASLSLMSLGLLSVSLSIPKQIVVVDSNLVDNDVVKSLAALEEEDDDDDDDDDNDNGAEFEGRKGVQVTSHQASHTNYLLMRGYCFPGIVKLRNLTTNDNIVVEPCILRLKLRDKPAHGFFSDETSLPLDLSKYGPSLLPSLLSANIQSSSSSPPSVEECDRCFIQDRGYTDQDIKVCAHIRRSLDEAGVNGLDERDLHRVHVHLLEPQSGCTRNLQQYLKDLQEESQVVRVGSLCFRWVLMQHADPWLLTVNCKQTSQSNLTLEKNRLRNPFMRKRCLQEPQGETGEPPAKKLSVDKEKGPNRENTDELLSNVTKTPKEEEQLQEQNETMGGAGGGESQNLNEKEEVPMHPDEKREEVSGGEDKSPNLKEEGRVQTHPDNEREEDDGQEKMETGQKHDGKRRTRSSSLEDERIKEAGTLPTASAADNEENVSFVSRPWRFIDGKVNRSVCKGMLEAVLYHIMSQPGVTQQALLDYYKDSLQPVVVLELLQALIELKCVTEKTLVKGPKPSLFGRSAHQTKSETAFEEADTVFYEPTLSSCLRLCRVLPNERHWNDFAQ